MDKQLLREVLAVLKQIRSELLDNAEDSIIWRLDQTIRDLEVAEREEQLSREITPHDLLELLRIILERLPAFLALYELLRRLLG